MIWPFIAFEQVAARWETSKLIANDNEYKKLSKNHFNVPVGPETMISLSDDLQFLESDAYTR